VTWLTQLASDKSGHLSSSRAIALGAGLTLCFSTALLTVGSFWHPEMLPTLMAFGPSLAGLAAMNYGVQRWATKEKASEV
jgi:hypothetical protein